jgi:hypothetical protein
VYAPAPPSSQRRVDEVDGSVTDGTLH